MGETEIHDQEGMTPLMCASQYARPRHIALLYEGKSNHRFKLRNLVTVMLNLVVAGADITAIDIEQKTALHWTARNPDPSCVQELLNIYPPLLNNRFSQSLHNGTCMYSVGYQQCHPWPPSNAIHGYYHLKFTCIGTVMLRRCSIWWQ